MNYDFDNLKKRYGLEEEENISSFDELDDIENDDSLYNELIPSSTYNLEDTIKFEKDVLEQINDVKPITISDSENEISEIFEDELEKTLEIDTFKLDYELEELLEPEARKKETKKRKWWHLPMSTANDHHLEHAFVNCAVLGFITAAMGSGMLLYIINHINPL